MSGAAMTPLEAALRYAALGLSVSPLHTPTAGGCSCWRASACASAGKHPRLDWKRCQTRAATADEIRGWWHRWPNANVSIVTGSVSGLAVLDVDPRNGGLETLAELDAHGGRMPDDNPLAITGSGGLHHYFSLGVPLAKGAPFEGIELQADGALVVAAPSLHASGRRYEWARGIESPWPPLPAWLRWAVEQSDTGGSTGPPPPLCGAERDDVLGALLDAGLYLGAHRRPGLHRVRCPWADAHSNADPEAAVMVPGASPAPGWAFRCLHSHCSERRIGDLLDVLRITRRRAT